MGLFPPIHFLLSALFLGTVWIGIRAGAGQIPLQNNLNGFNLKPPAEYLSWNFLEKPSPDSTAHLIFDTVNSFLQRWTNTRYRNGHNIVPATIPIGTLLYHGTTSRDIPRTPEWTALDPEFSYMFCKATPEDAGCWFLTLATTRPLRVLYFDGSSAAKFPGGSLDTQHILLPSKPDSEVERINDLCRWGKQYGIDGFVRMQADFEVMLCDFSVGVEAVSFNHVTANEVGHGLGKPSNFRVMETGRWHDYFPGETRIHLNYAGVVSLYDTTLFPSLKSLRSNTKRLDHRLEGMDSKDVETLLKTLGSILDAAWDRPVSGIDWKTFLRVVVDRYVGRLQVLNRLLNSTTLDSEADAMLTLKIAHNHTLGMFAPYRLYSASPLEHQSTLTHSWAIPVFEECATAHTRFIDSNPSLSQSLTYSEHLLLNSTKSVSKEICRVIVGMWAEGMEYSASKEGFVRSAEELVTRWKGLTEELMGWLDWSEWVTCQPACGDEELCYLPTWPLFTGPSAGHGPYPNPDSDGVDDSINPQPRCIPRIE